MKLHDLKPAKGSSKPRARLLALRAAAWFEGGQTPLHIRTPKLHGFKNRFRVEYAPLNLGRISEASAGTLITPDVLRHDQLLRDQKTRPMPVKILGGGDAPKGVTIHAHAFTRSALAKLAEAGSTAQLISWPDGAPISFEPEAPADSGPTGQRARKASARRASTASFNKTVVCCHASTVCLQKENSLNTSGISARMASASLAS